MANRICPICFGKVPRSRVVAHSYGFDCPQCGRALELSRPSRLLASLIGLLGAWLVFSWTTRAMAGTQDLRDWLLPVIASILTFGIVTPLFLMLNADLVVKPDAAGEPLAEPVQGHTSGGHP
jgi:hypothetical protein